MLIDGWSQHPTLRGAHDAICATAWPHREQLLVAPRTHAFLNVERGFSDREHLC